jgi:hypothetical protein
LRSICAETEWKEPAQALGVGADQAHRALAHFAGGLVGEGDDQHLAGPGFALVQDVGDAGGEDARLARAGAGQHQQRAVGRLHRVALFRVEAVHVVGRGVCMLRPLGGGALRDGAGVARGVVRPSVFAALRIARIGAVIVARGEAGAIVGRVAGRAGGRGRAGEGDVV